MNKERKNYKLAVPLVSSVQTRHWLVGFYDAILEVLEVKGMNNWKAYREKSDMVSVKPGGEWKGRRICYSVWYYKRNNKNWTCSKQWKHRTLGRTVPWYCYLSQNHFIPFLGLEIQVPNKTGPPDALRSPRSTQSGGVVGLPGPYFLNNQTVETVWARSKWFVLPLYQA